MFGKMMNNFYYGKSGKGDYRKEDLPQTRWQLFWEMLKIRFSGLCRLNLMYAVAWLPTLVVIIYGVVNWMNVSSVLAEQQALFEAGTLAADALAQTTTYLQEVGKAVVLQTLLILIPCIAITGPFTAGVAYVTRNWARDEHAFVWSDFKDAVKDNWKQGLAVSAITSLMPLVLYVGWMFYGEMARGNSLFVLLQGLCAMLVALWMCALLYLYPLMVTYQLRFRDLLRNGLLLTLGRLPMTVGLKLLSVVPVALVVLVAFLAGVPWALLAMLAYYVVIGFGLSRFVGASYTNAVFDRYINPNIEGATVGRGLYTDEAGDDEDERPLGNDGEDT